MKINFQKIATVLGSALLVGSTIGMAAAANYPAPFVQNGAADVAVVVGANALLSDAVAATNIGSNLATKLAAQTATGGTITEGTVTGEAIALFSGGTKIYVNDSLNAVKSVLTKSDLPTVLKDESFSGNADATITQTIDLGSNPRVTFEKQPSSDDDPNYALKTSTTTANYIYNASATFSKAINMTHADSEGESINLFGQKYTVAASTDATSLVLLQSAEKLSLDSDSPAQEVTIAGEVYTIELVSSSDTAATIKVTDSSGNSDSREVAEAASKKINGVTIAVTNADETNLKLSASIVAGSEKVTLTSGSEVTIGEDDTVIDGATATLTGGTGALTKLVVSITAAESDEDAIKAGESFVDPVFKSFKLDFAGLSIGDDSSAREDISFTPNSDDKMDITFTDHTGNEKTITWAVNTTAAGLQLMIDDSGRNITVFEGQQIDYNGYVVVGNEDEGHLLKLSSVNNATTSYNNDRVRFTDVFTGDTLDTTWTADGTGTLTVGGKSYDVTMTGNSANASEEYVVKLNYPDSSATSAAVLYPTIQTSKGAKIAFYEPTTINVSSWDGSGTDLVTLKLPDGDGYTDVTFALYDITNVSVNAGVTNLTSPALGTTVTVGQLTYNITGAAANDSAVVYLQTVGGARITRPAVVLFEERDDNTAYEALIVELEDGQTGDDGLGIDTVEDTWSGALSTWSSTMASDSKKELRGDLFGSIVTIDSSDSDQKTATISYPDEQIYAQIYVGEESSSISAGGASGGTATALGSITVYDSEVSSMSGKNLIVVGGSCINSVAAELLGEAACSEAFTTLTTVGAGEALIQSFDRNGKVALLVAGYNAADTTKAVTYLINNAVDTTAGGAALKVTSTTEATTIVA